MAGTAQRRRTKPKGGTTPCWDVSHQNSFHPVLKKRYCNNIINIIKIILHLTVSFCSVSDDRHRVKLHPLLGDPNSDYINANYIDVSLILLFCLCLTSDTNSQSLLRLTPWKTTVHLYHSCKPTSLLAHFHLEAFIQSNTLPGGVLPDAVVVNCSTESLTQTTSAITFIKMAWNKCI